MARIAGVNVPLNKRVEVGLTYVHGVGRSTANEILKKDIYAMISPLVWDHSIRGPWAMIAVGLADPNSPPFCTWWPPDGNYMIPDHFQIWSSFAYAYEITHDSTFLDYAAEGLGGGEIHQLIQQFADYNIECMSALDALIEKM